MSETITYTKLEGILKASNAATVLDKILTPIQILEHLKNMTVTFNRESNSSHT